ncbi:MAG: cytochrome c [Prolixibacteraceae bacterium]
MKKRRYLRWIFSVLVILVIAVSVLLVYVRQFLPDVSLKEVTVEVTPERVERGRYLANHVMVCMDCHSTRDWTKFAGPLVPGTEGKGGERFDQTVGMPGVFISPNITPFHLKDWSDAELYRVITSGVGKDNKPVFPVMPYQNYGKMDDEDIYSVIAYLRTLPEKESKIPEPQVDFPMNFILHLIPAEGQPAPVPPKSDVVNYGKYMVNAAACMDCHTPFEKGQLLTDQAFTGGREFVTPGGVLVSPNITPDKQSGIGNWTKDMFISRFKSFDPKVNEPHEVSEGAFNTIMPWTMYAGMDSTDLEAIYAYLVTLQPVEKQIVKFISKN